MEYDTYYVSDENSGRIYKPLSKRQGRRIPAYYVMHDLFGPVLISYSNVMVQYEDV